MELGDCVIIHTPEEACVIGYIIEFNGDRIKIKPFFGKHTTTWWERGYNYIAPVDGLERLLLKLNGYDKEQLREHFEGTLGHI